MSTVKLAILCVCYNQQKYIKDALDGFLMQKVSFPFEVWIADDCSTDNTKGIILEYMKSYPTVIKPIFRTSNIGSSNNFWNLVQQINAKYVALCEGDDYWTDPLKLQKQVDFLDAHPECSICFHPVTVKYENKIRPDSIFPAEKMLQGKTILEFDDLLKCNFIQTNSVMYRWRFYQKPLASIPENILPGDWFLHLLHAQVGKIGFLPDVMSVYRRNSAGIWTGAEENPEWFVRCGIPFIRFWQNMQRQFNLDCSAQINDIALLTKLCLSNAKQKEALDELLTICPNIPDVPHFIRSKLFMYTITKPFTIKRLRKKISQRKKILQKIIRLMKNSSCDC